MIRRTLFCNKFHHSLIRISSGRIGSGRFAKKWSTTDYEERFRSVGWDEYEVIANDEDLIPWYQQYTGPIASDKTLHWFPKLSFAIGTFFFIGVWIGYILNRIWHVNIERDYHKNLLMESFFFKRTTVFAIEDVFKVKTKIGGKEKELYCMADVVSSYEVPFLNFIQIKFQEKPTTEKVHGIFLQADELSQAYVKDEPRDDIFSFQSITELQMRLRDLKLDLENNTIEIPVSTEKGSTRKTQIFPIVTQDSFYTEAGKRWKKQLKEPVYTISAISTITAYLWAKFEWYKLSKNSRFIVECVYKPWSSSFVLGGRVSFVTTIVTATAIYYWLITNYKERNGIFERSDYAKELESMGDTTDLEYILKLGVAFVGMSTLLSLLFITPLATVIGRITVEQVNVRMSLILPRCTYALRNYKK